MKLDLDPKEIDLLISELEAIIPELRGVIASGVKKDLKDELKKDKLMLMDILEKLRKAA